MIGQFHAKINNIPSECATCCLNKYLPRFANFKSSSKKKSLEVMNKKNENQIDLHKLYLIFFFHFHRYHFFYCEFKMAFNTPFDGKRVYSWIVMESSQCLVAKATVMQPTIVKHDRKHSKLCALFQAQTAGALWSSNSERAVHHHNHHPLNVHLVRKTH